MLPVLTITTFSLYLECRPLEEDKTVNTFRGNVRQSGSRARIASCQGGYARLERVSVCIDGQWSASCGKYTCTSF